MNAAAVDAVLAGALDLHAVFDALPAALFVKDTQSRIVLMNRRCEQLWGLRFDQIAGTDGSAFFPPEQMQIFLSGDHKTFTNGAALEFNVPVWNLQTRCSQFILTTKNPVFDAQGVPRYLICLSMDVETLKLAQAQLFEKRERFQQLVNALPQMVWTAKTNGRLTFASQPLHQFFGTHDCSLEATGASIRKALSPHSMDLLARTWERAQTVTQEEFKLEIQAQRHDGEFRCLDLHAAPILNENGVLTRWVGTLTDTSDARRAEHHLRQSQKMEAIGQLTGGLAHDFNNLLGIVLGNLDMLRSQPLAAHVAKRIQIALGAAERGAELTKSLLAVARRQTLAPANTDLRQLIQGIEPLLIHTAGVRIETSVVLLIGNARALIDATGLESSLLNLVLNARDAMPNGGRLTLCLRAATAAETPSMPAAHYATIEITDSGMGMHADILARAMDPFFTTKERGEGTGLGLAMVNGFAHQSGGRLQIDSQPGAGTRTRLTLPLLIGAIDP